MILKKPDFLKSPLQHYQCELEEIFQNKASVYREKSVKKKLPFIYYLVFPKTDKKQLMCFSYGVSFATHPDQYNKIELFLQMDSEDLAWAHVVGYLANQLRGDCPFNTGEIIRMGQYISQDSKLNAFVVINPDHTMFPEPINDGRKSSGIQLVELLPIYEVEIKSIQKMGLPIFLNQLKTNKLNPKRKAI